MYVRQRCRHQFLPGSRASRCVFSSPALAEWRAPPPPSAWATCLFSPFSFFFHSHYPPPPQTAFPIHGDVMACLIAPTDQTKQGVAVPQTFSNARLATASMTVTPTVLVCAWLSRTAAMVSLTARITLTSFTASRPLSNLGGIVAGRPPSLVPPTPPQTLVTPARSVACFSLSLTNPPLESRASRDTTRPQEEARAAFGIGSNPQPCFEMARVWP